jgi:type I restriction enzyme M protein
MAEADWCGRDSRGRTIEHDDLPQIMTRFKDLESKSYIEYNHLGYSIQEQEVKDFVLAPRYYDPEVEQALHQLKTTHDLVTIGSLIKQGILEIRTGDEVGSMAYGTGNIPFVRTSDLSNWEIKIDPKQGISKQIYKEYVAKQDVRIGDLLMVKDGTYLIGTCAYITKYDTEIVYQSHLYKIRSNDYETLSPYLLLAVLGSQPVQTQIQSKRFTMDIIDSLGNRIEEIILPLPKSPEMREKISSMVSKAIQERIEARELARQACVDVIVLK